LQESIDEYDCFDGDIFMLNWDTNWKGKNEYKKI
jgi:hypothetical protein